MDNNGGHQWEAGGVLNRFGRDLASTASQELAGIVVSAARPYVLAAADNVYQRFNSSNYTSGGTYLAPDDPRRQFIRGNGVTDTKLSRTVRRGVKLESGTQPVGFRLYGLDSRKMGFSARKYVSRKGVGFYKKYARPMVMALKRGYGRLASLPGLKHGRGRGESRYVDNNPVNQNISSVITNAQVYPLNLTLQGTAVQNRFGNKVALKALNLRYHIVPVTNVISDIQPTDIRVMVVYDKQTNGVTPAISDILLTVDENGTSSTNTDSFPNNFNRDRFVILYDKLFRMPFWSHTSGAAPATIYPVGWSPTMCEIMDARYIKLKNIETNYKGNSGGIGDISTGGLFLLYFGNQVYSANGGYQIDFGARLKFADN